MREILFRVWNGMNYEYDIMVGKFGAFYVNPMNEGLDVGDSASLSPFNTKFSDDVVIEQFTGLMDKKGKKIFEGDIVKVTDHTMEETFESCGATVTQFMTRVYEVFWNETKWSIRSLESELAFNPPVFDLPIGNITYEIIGNIHEIAPQSSESGGRERPASGHIGFDWHQGPQGKRQEQGSTP